MIPEYESENAILSCPESGRSSKKKLRENIKILDFLLPKTSLSHIALLFLGPPFTFHSPRTVVLNLFGKSPSLMYLKT